MLLLIPVRGLSLGQVFLNPRPQLTCDQCRIAMHSILAFPNSLTADALRQVSQTINKGHAHTPMEHRLKLVVFAIVSPFKKEQVSPKVVYSDSTRDPKTMIRIIDRVKRHTACTQRTDVVNMSCPESISSQMFVLQSLIAKLYPQYVVPMPVHKRQGGIQSTPCLPHRSVAL